MNVDQIKTISVIGSGAMGSQIAMVSALAGYSVTLQDIQEESVVKAEQSLRDRLGKRVDKGKMSKEELDEAFSNMTFTTSLEEAVRDADFVIEAIVENLEIKRTLFEDLDQLAPKHAILSTNSSTIVSSKVADATNRPGKVCNFHFFNPALVMEMVEVVQGPHTSNETAEVAMELARRLNKTPILLKKEISGFVANRILAKLMNEALYLYENEIATAEEIDLACTKALNHPIGPFALIDLTGLDVHYNIRQYRYEETGNEEDKPSPVIVEKVKKGDLGRKSGKGFYSYS
ncbi:3-hydroxyacyl-CoA dehydrogenase family protein [Alteribacter keqinensis]|uniref:3-hydroxyacyl-CoA dehydrogenase family protein n=1 Tax=Alteribacter keqinensis TaxID=2483800 RepID=A0A3M7TKZ6_9BACI|nr:3-hydroxyacyl-CoA dehydrogenase family protein [Alteribacter keqinensis]RNA66229.1 3-hydroxyacyl-CoA dehydrogenase family protein [Alteribacter keqinensis]